MSTKIYDGYVLPPMSAYQLKQIINKLRENFEPIKDRLISQRIAEDFINTFDLIWTGKVSEDWVLSEFREKDSYGRKPKEEISDWEKNSILTSSIFYLQRHQVEEAHHQIWRTQRRDPAYDFQFSLCFMPTEEKTFVTIYTEQKEYEDIWKNIEGVEYYPYWDNTDPMKGYTWEQWEERGKEWEKAMDNFDNPPALIGLSWQFLRDSHLFLWNFTSENILPYIPSFEDRVKHRAYILATEHVFNQLKEKAEEESENEIDTISLYMRAERFVRKDEEGQAIKKEFEEKSSKILKSEITIEDFKLTYSQIIDLSNGKVIN